MTQQTQQTQKAQQTPGYAIAYLRDIDLNDQIADYLRRIDATLDAHGGRFVVHGGRLHPLEGEWSGTVVLIEFPSTGAALEWYASPGYQEIAALRTDNSNSMAAVLDGVPPGYRAADSVEVIMAG